MNAATDSTDRSVELALREILEPLDRQLARVAALLPLALVTLVPLVFFSLWLGADLSGRHSLVMAGGACCAIVAMYLVWELLTSRLARWRFDRCFPPGTAARAIALAILSEMETPSKAEEKLRVALASVSSDRIIRHRRSSATRFPEVAFPTTGLPLDLPAPSSSAQVQVGSSPPVAPSKRPGGYYDYIPLEPRTSDSSPPNPAQP